MDLVPITEEYYEFVRKLRMHPENAAGFLEAANITEEQQKEYMEVFKNCYFVCLIEETPVGYVGVIDGDIRICADPTKKGRGVGTFMLTEITKKFP